MTRTGRGGRIEEVTSSNLVEITHFSKRQARHARDYHKKVDNGDKGQVRGGIEGAVIETRKYQQYV